MRPSCSFGLRVVGAARARRRLAGDALAAARERASGATATPTRCASAQRDADYAYRLAVDPPAAKELRLFGLVGWTIDRFVARRTRLHELQYAGDAAARAAGAVEPAARRRPPTSSCSGRWRRRPPSGRLDLGELVVYAQARVGTSLIAFGGLNWALDGAAAPVAAVLRLEPAMAPAGALASGRATPPAACRRARSASATSRFAYPGGAPVLERLRPHDPRRLVARDRRPERRRQDDAGQAAVPALRPAGRRDRGRRRRPARARPRRRGASRVTAVFQDFIRFELPLRDNVAPARRARRRGARGARGGRRRAASPALDTILARGYDGRHRPVGRAVAARRAGARAVRRAARRRRRAARRADRAARRARRGGDLRAHPRRDAALHDDPDLAPLLDRAPRRPHLRARARPGRSSSARTTS